MKIILFLYNLAKIFPLAFLVFVLCADHVLGLSGCGDYPTKLTNYLFIYLFIFFVNNLFIKHHLT